MTAAPQVGDVKAWFIPRVPGEPIEIAVNSIAEGWLIVEAIARYDQYLVDRGLKGDDSNAGGVAVFDLDGDSEWADVEEEGTP